MSGPPPTPTRLRLIRGNPSKRPLRPEPEPPLVEDDPIPPRILRGDALDEWRRVTKELQRLRMLTVLDLRPLAAYCQAYGRWMKAEDTLARMEDADPVTHALMVKGSLGNPIQNPLVKIAVRAGADMVRYAAEFGFSPAARTRVAGGVAARLAPGKFAGLLSDG